MEAVVICRVQNLGLGFRALSGGSGTGLYRDPSLKEQGLRQGLLLACMLLGTR